MLQIDSMTPVVGLAVLSTIRAHQQQRGSDGTTPASSMTCC